ncbi:MAG: DUF1566 domain-containing protein [Desulfuromonadaceae bacterium]|nr:DUF1566 domain-containing protein [Desulfuromonadaceae bacterium]MDD2856691.1 DUF1566 domain-containing protein [Desulfuromonadaceae bacterium]
MKKMFSIVIALSIFYSSFSAAFAASTVQLPQTGQTACTDTAGTVIPCTDTGQDGETKAGVAWPDPRFTDNSNGTVTDNLTGLIWLKNANCTDTAGGIAKSSGYLTWNNAITWSSALATGTCGLTDSSRAGQWRLPNRKELQSLVDRSQANPALPAGHPFSGVQSDYYWSSTSDAYDSTFACFVNMNNGLVSNYYKSYNYYVWPVRSGQ